MTRRLLAACWLATACTPRAAPRPPATLAPAVVTPAPAPVRVVATEIARLGGRWTGNLFRLHPVAANEAWVSTGLSLIHVQDAQVTSSDAMSRGLPVQTDPCFAPSIHEIHVTAAGERVLTLKDGGSPHFIGGCRDGLAGDATYAWRGDRWTPVPTPAWAISANRQLFAEARVGTKTVRLMGPTVGPESDGYSEPTEYEYLGSCFGAARSTLTSWDPPALPTLPADLCVEGIRFGDSTQDALYVGRTKDGKTWLERSAPGKPARRLPVDVPATCNVRSSPHVALSGIDQGTLEIDVHCNDTPSDEQTWTDRRVRFAYDGEGPVTALPPVDVADPFGPIQPGPGFRVTDSKRPAVAYAITDLVPAVTQVVGYGPAHALAEVDGHVFLLGPSVQSAPVTIDENRPGPTGAVLVAPPDVSAECRNGLRIFARVPVSGTVESSLAAKRAALLTLATAHADLARAKEPFVEFRIGDQAWLARAWPAADEGGPTEATTRKTTGWTKAAGLDFATSCVFGPTPGEGRAYRITGGQLVPATVPTP